MLVITAMLITMASILHIIEGLFPPMPVTGAKLGLANIITLTTIVLYGPKIAVSVAVGRTVLGSIVGSGIISIGFVMSVSGALLSWAVMSLLFHYSRKAFSLIGLSLVGAVAHNIAQLTVASFVLEENTILALLPFLMFFAIPTGIMVGLATGFLTRAMAKVPHFRNR